MLEMIQLLAETNLFLLAFSVFIFDIPRFTLSLLSLALFGVRKQNYRGPEGNVSVSVIIPTFNGGSGLDRSIASLHRQTLRPVARRAWWTWLFSGGRFAARPRQQTPRPGLPAAICF